MVFCYNIYFDSIYVFWSWLYISNLQSFERSFFLYQTWVSRLAIIDINNKLSSRSVWFFSHRHRISVNWITPQNLIVQGYVLYLFSVILPVVGNIHVIIIRLLHIGVATWHYFVLLDSNRILRHLIRPWSLNLNVSRRYPN